MFLEIFDHKTVGTLKQEFANHFPFLKIVFFAGTEEAGDTAHGRPLSDKRVVRAARYRHNNGAMEINPRLTAQHIEKCFRERFGLHVHVYRRTLKGWTPASRSYGMTLKEHNETGRRIVESGYPANDGQLMK